MKKKKALHMPLFIARKGPRLHYRGRGTPQDEQWPARGCVSRGDCSRTGPEHRALLRAERRPELDGTGQPSQRATRPAQS